MTTAALNSQRDLASDEAASAVPGHVVAIFLAGLVAAWLAAGSTGLMASPLQNATMWLALGVAIVAGWPGRSGSLVEWLVLAAAAALGLLMTAAAQPVLSISAVALVLAAIAYCQRGLAGRVVLLAAFAAIVLALWRLTLTAIPTVWLAADALGESLGRLAGRIAGAPLSVGATFAGLDLLIVMAVIYVGWLAYTPRPRLRRAMIAAVAIILAQFAYLIVLASCDRLLAMLPDVVVAPQSDVNRVGIWMWGNAARTLLPWNLPLLGAIVQTIIAGVMVRGSKWLPVVGPEPLPQRPRQYGKAQTSAPTLAGAARLTAVALAVAIPLATTLTLNKSDLIGKTIVAYEFGEFNWQKPQYDEPTPTTGPAAVPALGTLPLLVESLGGQLVRSQDLSEQELARADVLLVVHPNRPWPEDRLERIRQFVRSGKSLLVLAGPRVEDDESQSSFDDVLEPTAIQVRDDAAVPAAEHWQSCLETFSHASTVGISGEAERVGLAKCSSLSLRWPARPILTGRFGWGNPHSAAGDSDSPEYDPGERLGDVVLAAEQSLGRGRVVVLGDTTPLSNDASPSSYNFTGRLLGYLAGTGGGPQAWWRQLLGLLGIAALVAVLAWQAEAWRTGLTALALGASLATCVAVSSWSGQVLPDGREHSPNNIACIDASHLESYSRDPQNDLGLGALARVLTRDGYLPLLLPEVSAERLERAAMLISIAPAKPFSPGERQVVRQFVQDGGVLICLVGAEEAPASRELLADYGFRVPHSPVGPTENVREPEPAGAYYYSYLDLKKYKTYMRFYAGWPVECAETDAEELMYGPGNTPMIIRRTVGRGSVTVVGDTHFASNWNLLQATRGQPTENGIFWRWFLSRITGRKEWLPPEPIRESGPLDEKGAGGPEDEGERP